MNVVVSAIVDPWVTTFSFVVALAMRIQGQKIQILCRNQARNSWHCLVRVGRLSLCSLADGNAPVGGHPGPEEVENCGNDGQNDDGGNQRTRI